MKRRNFSSISRVKEHKRGKFANPYFKHRKVRHRRRLRVALVVTVLVLVATPIAVIASPLFRMTDIAVTGLTTIPENDINTLIQAQQDKKRLGVFSQTNKLFFHKHQLEETLNDAYQFSSIDINIEKNTLRIHLIERISEVVWVNQEDMYMLDLDGVIVRALYDVEHAQIDRRLGREPIPVTSDLDIILAPTMPIIFDDSQSVVLPGQNHIAPISVADVIAFDEGLRRLLIHPKTYGLEEPGTPWLRVDTDLPFDVLFDATADIDTQLRALRSVIQDQQDVPILEYIDLRFGTNVYVK